ncbi:MAG: hypothetical protein RMK84_15145 [Oscillochloridaceae bacterium]|nr:hypothetical protein [Chloroflexaceae bacterium]MDW8391459.1 hypothetical protein [Oscillochloridaceae bacterium]
MPALCAIASQQSRVIGKARFEVCEKCRNDAETLMVTHMHVHCRALRSPVAALVTASIIFVFLSGCAAPTAVLDQALIVAERQSGFDLRPPLPVDLVRQALIALDQEDPAAVRQLMAHYGPYQQQLLDKVRQRWPDPLFGRPDLVVSIGPYRTRSAFDPVPWGTSEVVPVRIHCQHGVLTLRITVMMTGAGWRIAEIR